MPQKPAIDSSLPSMDDVVVALCEIAAGKNREAALSLINEYLAAATTPIKKGA